MPSSSSNERPIPHLWGEIEIREATVAADASPRRKLGSPLIHNSNKKNQIVRILTESITIIRSNQHRFRITQSQTIQSRHQTSRARDQTWEQQEPELLLNLKAYRNGIWMKKKKQKWLKCCRGALLLAFMLVHGGHQPSRKLILELRKPLGNWHVERRNRLKQSKQKHIAS